MCLFYVLMWSKLLAECLRPVCLVLFVFCEPGLWFAVSSIYGRDYSFSRPKRPRVKEMHLFEPSDKREAYKVSVSFMKDDWGTGWNLNLVFQQNYSIPINNISVVGMDLEICWWPCLPKLRQPRATEQARMMSCSWIWGDTIKGSRIKLGRGSSCYVQFAL